jgi:hypothetical protein
MTFTLKINLGNDAMQTPEDVAEALRNAAVKVAMQGGNFDAGDGAGIRDENGNTVGSWKVTGR